MKSGLCFVSLDFQGGIFNQISSEASLEDLANLNATREGQKNSCFEISEILHVLISATQEHFHSQMAR
jgi:hypothetical protein